MTTTSSEADARVLREHLLSMQRATAKIGESLGLEETVRALGQAMVPSLADFAAIHLLDRLFSEEDHGAVDRRVRWREAGAFRRMAVFDGTEHTQWAAVAPEGVLHVMSTASPGRQALASGRPVMVPRVGAELAKEMASAHCDGDIECLVRDNSLLAVPLIAGARQLGCLILLRGPAQQSFDEIEVLTATLLAAQASQGIDSACRYRSEAAIASAIQLSMLPTKPLRLPGVEVAHRYLPSSKDTQVGGDWFDAIVLPGGRVALVVGDVMGHGIRSAAIMGHLRTSVQTLAAVDLPPEQVLRHLDDIARRLDDDHLATCVYAVYDPVAHSCMIANAGHIPPVLVHQRGQAELLTRLPAGAPIGVGGVPFEPMEVKIADGDMLVMCTDGLVEMRGQDIGSGLAALCDLAAPDATPDELCETLMQALHVRDREDDVALLIARLRGIPSSDIAQWLLQPQPTTPGQVRRLVRRTLADWGLSVCTDVTELLASELVTNAVRHATRPIELRLMRTDVLLCEVKDDDHHLPVLRASSGSDEVGRGLSLVSSLARRWGANRTIDGKVVWFDLPLPSR
ncbi:MAG TPA: SpoIIE family protein phosphatase [Streptosporangiaceae bacterium]|nr:SpoIIE family protein phosphatase [Streptosporangiaceae bacterium]